MLSLQLYFKATDPFSERWQSAWIITAFWDILAFALLCIICYLWAPSQSSQRCSAVSIFLLMMKIFLKEKLSKKKKLFQFEKKVPLYQSSDGQVDYLMGSFPFKIIWNNH
jgi:hypothetical protein